MPHRTRTGAFGTDTRKRYDDTELLLAEISENGQDSMRGRAAIDRINEMHGLYRISNADMLYVLTTFVVEPVRWLERFGRRPMTRQERNGWTNYHRALGERMGIEAIPESYEAAHFRYADSNVEIAGATRYLLLSFYLPQRLVPLGRPLVHASAPAVAGSNGASRPPRTGWRVLCLPASRCDRLCCAFYPLAADRVRLRNA